jgi:hypothetical protein
MNSLLKQMKAEKTPQLKKYICLPLLLSPDRDEELLKLSEHRSVYSKSQAFLTRLYNFVVRYICSGMISLLKFIRNIFKENIKCSCLELHNIIHSEKHLENGLFCSWKSLW